MIKKTLTYDDLDGNKVTEDFWFHLSKSEIIEMEMSAPGGLSEQLKVIVKENDPREILRVFKEILSKAYGKRSDDGKRFMKDPKYWQEFTESNAFDVLFFELLSDASASAQFFNGVVPSDLVGSGPVELVKAPRAVEDVSLPFPEPIWIRENRRPTNAELDNASEEELMMTMQFLESFEEQPEVPAWIREERDPTKAEQMKMSKDELRLAMKLKMQRKAQRGG